MKTEANITGFGITVLVHLGLAAAAMAAVDAGGGIGVPSSFEDAEVIEASLAFKKVEPKSKQPQKQKKETYEPPEAIKISREPDKVVEPKKEEKKEKVKPDEIDPASVLKKNRTQEEDLSSTGVTEVPQEGSDQGSEWGTEREAKNDPYLGELKGRLWAEWNYPSISSDEGNAEGCLRLDDEGRIVEFEVKKGKNADLNQSVYLALKTLKEGSGMGQAVPSHLERLLTVKGVCFRMTPKDR